MPNFTCVFREKEMYCLSFGFYDFIPQIDVQTSERHFLILIYPSAAQQQVSAGYKGKKIVPLNLKECYWTYAVWFGNNIFVSMPN
jgi:hypothetical protein